MSYNYFYKYKNRVKCILREYILINGIINKYNRLVVGS